MRGSDLRRVMAAAAERAPARREADAKRKAEKSVERREREGYGLKDVEAGFRDGIRALRGPGYRLPAWTGKQRGLATKMLKEYGAVLVEAAVTRFVSGWEATVAGSNGRLSGDPTVELLWGMRARVFAEVQGVEPAKRVRGKNSDEYDSSKVSDDDLEVGW